VAEKLARSLSMRVVTGSIPAGVHWTTCFGTYFIKKQLSVLRSSFSKL